MTIIIDDRYLIEVDKWNYTLLERTGKLDKNENEVFKPHGHFGSVESALIHLAKIQVLSSNDKLTVAEYIRELKDTAEQLVNACKGV